MSGSSSGWSNHQNLASTFCWNKFPHFKNRDIITQWNCDWEAAYVFEHVSFLCCWYAETVPRIECMCLFFLWVELYLKLSHRVVLYSLSYWQPLSLFTLLLFSTIIEAQRVLWFDFVLQISTLYRWRGLATEDLDDSKTEDSIEAWFKIVVCVWESKLWVSAEHWESIPRVLPSRVGDTWHNLTEQRFK